MCPVLPHPRRTLACQNQKLPRMGYEAEHDKSLIGNPKKPETVNRQKGWGYAVNVTFWNAPA